MALTEAEKQQILELKEKYERVSAQAGAPNPEGKYAGSEEKRQAFEKQRETFKQQAEAAKAEYETAISSNPELAAYAKEHPATQYELRRYATDVTGYDPASQPDRARNKGDIDVRRDELIFSIARSNPSYSLKQISEEYSGRSSALLPENVTINYEATLAARQQGLNVGSAVYNNLPETYQKEWDRQFGERNKIISLTESLGGPKPKTQTEYFVGLTEGGITSPTKTSKEKAISLTEGKPRTPQNLTQEQVNKLSDRDYAIYQAEYAAYNKYVAEKNREATAKNLAGWQEYKGDLLGEIAGLKEKGVTSLSIGYKEGGEQKGKQVPIERAFFEIITTKNVTGIGVPLDVPEGYTVVGSPGINMAYYPVEENRYGPDEAYTGMFKDPKKGTKDYDLLASLGRNVKRTGEIAATEAAKLGLSLVGGIGALGLKVKGEEPILIGNATIPEELGEAPIISSPLTQQIQQTPAQKAVAASGGGDYTQRNVQSVQTYLSALEQARAKDATRKYGEDPFVFALKEQKKQTPFETIKDVGEGIGVGVTRASIFLTATAPQTVIDQLKSGDFSEKTTQARFQKDEEDLRKLGVGPSVIGEALSGRGTGRSPAYNIGEAIGEIGTGFLVGGSPKAPKIAKPGVPMSGLTKARILTKAQASSEKNIYGVEAAIEGRAATGFISKRFESLKAKFRQPRQFIGGIGTEAERDLFKPLTTEPEIPGPKVTPKGETTFEVGRKGEKVPVPHPEIIEPVKGKPSETPALVIDTGEKGLTGVVRATPKEKIESQIGIIVRGDVTPGNLKRLGLKQVSTDEKGVPVFAARLPKGAKKREKFFSILSEAEELGFIKRVTDIDFIPTERALGIATGKKGQGIKVKGRKDITFNLRKLEGGGEKEIKTRKTSKSDILDKLGYKIETGISKMPQIGKGDYLVGADVGFAKKIITPGFKKTAMFTHPLKPQKIFIARPGMITPEKTQKILSHETLHNLLGKMGEFEASEKLDVIEYGSAKGDVIKKIIPEAYNEGRLGKENTIDILLNLSDETVIQSEKNFLARPKYVPRKEPVKIEYEKSKGRKDIRFGERKESYGPRQIRNEFQTAPYYETTASMGTPRELRIKGTTEGRKIDEEFAKAIEAGKISKGKPKLEDEFGLTGVDAGLKEAGLSPALKPKAEKGIKKFEDFAKPIEQGKGGAGRGGKIEPISQEKALDIAASIKPLTQGVTTKPTVIEKPVVPISGYEFETEVTGKYTRTIPSDLSGSRIETGTRDIFRTESRLDARQKDILGEAAKQVQPQGTMQGIRIETITGQKQKEREMEKSAVAEKLVFGQEQKPSTRQALRTETITGQKQKQQLVQKLVEPEIPKVPEELIPRIRMPPAPRIPEIEKRKTKREKEEKKEAIPFIGNVFEEQVPGGFKEFDIKYGQKKVSRQSALGLSITRKGKERFVGSRSAPVLAKKEYLFTESKKKRIGKSGLTKPGKKFSW